MKLSDKQLIANRLNAQKSTGPKTPEGKSVSRANSLVHGLCALEIVAEDPKTLRKRSLQFFDALRPLDDFQCWAVCEVSLLAIKIERAALMDRCVRDKIAIKAELSWGDDNRFDAEMLGEQLGNRPAVVVEKLRATPQGCEWLIKRWAMLAYTANSGHDWDAGQVRLAFDLLATPADFRKGPPGLAIDMDGNAVEPKLKPAEVARREIAELKARMEEISGIDQANRALAMVNLYHDHDAELKRVRKYEGTLHSRLRWFMNQLDREKPERETPRWMKERWLGSEPGPIAQTSLPTASLPMAMLPTAMVPEPTPVQEPPPEWAGKVALVDAIHAPFELEPDEIPPIGVKPDFPKIHSNRGVKQSKKAEGRRQARRKKVEQLIA
jgi:hypothetical protein